MRKSDDIRRDVREGALTHAAAQTELLLDIRELVAQVAVNTRKPGRPRKSVPEPTLH